MLSKPVDGEVTVKVGDFEGKANYLTDIPNDCLDAFIFALDRCLAAAIYFQYNEHCFYILTDEYNTYVIKEKNGKLFYKSEVTIEELAKELVGDILENIDDWSVWKYYMGSLDWDADEERKILEEKAERLYYLIGKRFKL